MLVKGLIQLFFHLLQVKSCGCVTDSLHTCGPQEGELVQNAERSVNQRGDLCVRDHFDGMALKRTQINSANLGPTQRSLLMYWVYWVYWQFDSELKGNATSRVE